jgi:hypothetical protein
MKKLVTVFTIMLIVSSGIAHADGFTNESIQGTYAVKGIFGSHDGAAIGIATYDGHGNGTASAIQNLPGLFWQRNVIESSFEETISVNPDGTLVSTVTFTIPEGGTVTMHSDGVIMQAEYIDGIKVATEIFAIQREPMPPLLGKPGSIATFTAKRLPD